MPGSRGEGSTRLQITGFIGVLCEARHSKVAGWAGLGGWYAAQASSLQCSIQELAREQPVSGPCASCVAVALELRQCTWYRTQDVQLQQASQLDPLL